MKIKELLEKQDYELLQGSIETDISDIVYDSRHAGPGMLFVAIAGTVTDGHKYISEVISKGVSAVVVEKETEVENPDITMIKVADGRAALSLISQAFFGYPMEKMVSVGITGTKGKSTTAHMIKDIIEKSGKRCGLIGTVGIYIDGKTEPAEHTTPESYDLQRYFAEMVKAGCEYVVMEVSSQGIKMKRVHGLMYDYGVFTNLSPDHIGPNEHKDFEEYKWYKSRLFQMCRTGIINSDDEHWRDIVKEATCEIKTYGMKKGDMIASAIENVNEGGRLSVKFHSDGILEGDVIIGMPGRYNAYNGMCAALVGMLLGVPEPVILQALEYMREVRGRLESVPTGKGFSVLIDFAHNGVSAKSVLNALREYHPSQIIAVFGCGGDRSRLRRYEMGEVVGNLAELAVVTSDNPRTEDVMDIVEDIKVGLSRTNGQYVVIPDRQEAVDYAVSKAGEGDIVILLGKGQEEYQEIQGVKYPYSEREAVENALKKL